MFLAELFLISVNIAFFKYHSIFNLFKNKLLKNCNMHIRIVFFKNSERGEEACGLKMIFIHLFAY